MRIGVTALSAAFLCTATGCAPGAPPRLPGTEPVPALGQVSYRLTYRSPVGLQTEFVSPLGLRTETASSGHLTIWDIRTGTTYDFNPHTGRSALSRGRSAGGPRYYDGQPWLRRLGPCSYLGELANLWSRPAFGYADAEEACITPDGILLALRDADMGRLTREPVALERGPQPDELFRVPPK